MRRAFGTGWLLVLGGLLPYPLDLSVATTVAAEPTSAPAVAQELDPTLAPPEAVPATPLPVPSGAAARATLGVQLLPLTMAGDPYRSPVAEGALIGSILPGSPADRAGLPLGGVIVAIDGRRVTSPADAVRIIQSATPDQRVEVKYYDGNRLFRKNIQLAPTTAAEPFLPPQRSIEAPPVPLPPQLPQRRAVREGIGRLLEQFAVPPPPTADLPTVRPAAGMPIDQLQQQVDDLQRQVAELQARIAKLEERLSEQAPR